MTPIDRVPDYIRSLVPYAPGKPIEEVEREYGIQDSVKLASNENPLGPSPLALKVLREKASQLNRYPDGHCFYLTRGLCRKWTVAPERIIFGNGSNELIELIVRTFLQPGDEAVMADQSFVIYRLVVQAAGGRSRVVPLKNFTHDLDAIGRALTENTRLIFLSNPNNPTGTIYRRREWEAFLKQVSTQIIIVADEAYGEYVTDPEYPESLAYQGQGRSIVTLRTFSKLYGLAGLRIGYAIGPAELIGMMHRLRQPFNVNAAAQWAALAALDDEEHVSRSVGANRQGMTFLTGELARLGVEYVSSQANFILMRVGHGRRVFEQLLKRGVIVRPMEEYHFPEYIRVTVGQPQENRKFVRELEQVIEASR